MKHTMFEMYISVIILLTGFSLINCDNTPKPSDPPPVNPYAYQIPTTQSDGWITADARTTGFDIIPLETLTARLDTNYYDDFHSLLIIHEGTLIFERYFNGRHIDSLHHIFSCTKSVTSALIGIAGLLDSLETPVFNLFPAYSHYCTPEKDSLNLKHLLTMTDGLAWDEWSYPYTDPQNSFYQMHHHSTYFADYILSLSPEVTPGSRWRYNSGTSVLLGQIIKHITSLWAQNYADSMLFKPLGITEYYWMGDWRAQPYSEYGLHLRARDMAKLGQLYLDNGVWNGQQLIPSSWVSQSIARHAEAGMWGNSYGYGFQFWLGSYIHKGLQYESFFASGDEGQLIIGIPSLDIVIITTGGRENDNGLLAVEEMLKTYILPALLD